MFIYVHVRAFLAFCLFALNCWAEGERIEACSGQWLDISFCLPSADCQEQVSVYTWLYLIISNDIWLYLESKKQVVEQVKPLIAGAVPDTPSTTYIHCLHGPQAIELCVFIMTLLQSTCIVVCAPVCDFLKAFNTLYVLGFATQVCFSLKSYNRDCELYECVVIIYLHIYSTKLYSLCRSSLDA